MSIARTYKRVQDKTERRQNQAESTKNSASEERLCYYRKAGLAFAVNGSPSS